MVVAAVDVGILNLTNYKPPAPDEYYLGQRRLTADIRDLYGQLIDGMQGAQGQIRSGGDGGAELTGSPPTQAPLALYSGIVKVAADGSAQVSFDIPAFAGTVRVMAVAWSKDKLGKATGDVVVRDPVVLTATLPRFLRTGDHGAVQFELDNVEGAAGDYAISVSAQGTAKIEGGKQTLTLDAKKRGHVSLPVTASGAGASTIDVSVSGPNGFALDRAYALNVRPATQTLVAPQRAAACRRRDADAQPRHVRRLRARHRTRGALGRDLDLARCREPAQCARPLSVHLLRADHQRGHGHAVCEGFRPRSAGGGVRRHRPTSAGFHRAAHVARGLQRLVRPVVGGRRRYLARRLRHRFPHARARARLQRCRRPGSIWRSTACAITSATRRSRARTAAAISPMRSTCWRATRPPRSATCAISPTSSSPTWRHPSPRRRSAPRSPCSATRRAPSRCLPPRSRRFPRSRSSMSAATISARACAIPRRW